MASPSGSVTPSIEIGVLLAGALSDPATRNSALGADFERFDSETVQALVGLLSGDAETRRSASGALYTVRWDAMQELRASLDQEGLSETAREAAWAVMKRIADHDDPDDAEAEDD